MADEIPPTPAETPVPPVVNETPAPIQTPPPAASLVVNGVKSETEIQLEGRLSVAERRAIEAERKAAELERDNQLLKEIPKPRRVKRWQLPSTLIGSEDDED